MPESVGNYNFKIGSNITYTHLPKPMQKAQWTNEEALKDIYCQTKATRKMCQ